MQRPLIEETKEKLLPHLDNKYNSFKSNDGKSKTPMIVTICFTIFVALLTYKACINYYYGFKYKDYTPFAEGNLIEGDEVAVDLDSYIVQETYKKIRPSSSTNLAQNFYTGELVNLNSLSREDISNLLYFYFTGNVCSGNITKSNDEVNAALQTLFGAGNFILNDGSQGWFDLNVNPNTLTYNFNNVDCSKSGTKDVRYNIMTSAATIGDYLFIYEKFGYSQSVSEKTYKIYGSYKDTKELTTFVKTNNTDFSNFNILKDYKWTFKKGQNNEYYFVSIETI